VSLSDSGIYLYRANNDMLVVDAGDIGPSYQPGHTHCDMLSYELMLEGQRVVVDTGVCEYQPGLVRQHLRSTRAHNTVAVGGAEQSEVWGEFRVARRAKVLAANICDYNNTVVFKGAYRGFHAVGRHVEHHRVMNVERDPTGSIDVIECIDTVVGAKGAKMESFIHLHPDAKLTTNNNQLNLSFGTKLSCVIEIPNDVNFYVEESYYCPEFGVKTPNICVVLECSSGPSEKLSYTIRKI
jgi:uncharacterized heparinase superfamily protein